MKKVLSTLTALATALTLAACTKTEEPSGEIFGTFAKEKFINLVKSAEF